MMREKDQDKVLWHLLGFYFLEITLFMGKCLLVLFIKGHEGRVLMTGAEPACWVYGWSGKPRRSMFP